MYYLGSCLEHQKVRIQLKGNEKTARILEFGKDPTLGEIGDVAIRLHVMQPSGNEDRLTAVPLVLPK